MRRIANLLVDERNKQSHILRGNGQRACKCRVDKSSTKVVEGVDLDAEPIGEYKWNVCGESWIVYDKEMKKLMAWVS